METIFPLLLLVPDSHKLVDPPFTHFPEWLVQDLRSDHAGETGAVMIYRGILAVSRDPVVREFALEHLATEQKHLQLIETLLPAKHRSLALFLWKPAGFLTGAIPALMGREWVFHSIQAVETFVDWHYQEQIDRLQIDGEFPLLMQTLIECQQDEVHHRDDAAQRVQTRPGLFRRFWVSMIASGSAAAVAVARRI